MSMADEWIKKLWYMYTNGILSSHKKEGNPALAGVAQWIEHRPVNQRVIGSIPSQGPGRVGSSRGRTRGNHTLMLLSLSPSLPLCLKVNK